MYCSTQLFNLRKHESQMIKAQEDFTKLFTAFKTTIYLDRNADKGKENADKENVEDDTLCVQAQPHLGIPKPFLFPKLENPDNSSSESGDEGETTEALAHEVFPDSSDDELQMTYENTAAVDDNPPSVPECLVVKDEVELPFEPIIEADANETETAENNENCKDNGNINSESGNATIICNNIPRPFVVAKFEHLDLDSPLDEAEETIEICPNSSDDEDTETENAAVKKELDIEFERIIEDSITQNMATIAVTAIVNSINAGLLEDSSANGVDAVDNIEHDSLAPCGPATIDDNANSPNKEDEQNESRNNELPSQNAHGFSRKKRVAKKKQHICKECGKNYFDKSNLKRHIMIHLDIRNFSCIFCDKAFRERYRLEKHLLTHNPKQNKCTETSRRSLRKSSVQSSVVYGNHGKSNYCTLCDLHCPAIKFRSHLHSWNHFIAEECEKAVKRKADNAEDFLLCTNCDDKFLSVSTLRDHFKACHFNSMLHCRNCDKKIKGWGQFRRHMYTKNHILRKTSASKNVVQRSYDCPHCSEKFRTKKSLKFHNKIHNSYRLCEFCGERFSSQNALTFHKKDYHEKEPGNESIPVSTDSRGSRSRTSFLAERKNTQNGRQVLRKSERTRIRINK